ncbi:MFS general substrate transporter [Laetiporus sulphureus 93-53]|uniref:MFS general substrate transporter n=1 Tax=Laetiporus sulphureus 93-53 TaxID=1314785 RepID=A0A165H574_9APHY|nr:MFS general substrate transporter [Laetiporus sulphureus 93-53]KZT11258.1 MFS general substrate transporter [Laetiporus sulphureus 93-53]
MTVASASARRPRTKSLSRLRSALICCSIAANAITAGGIYSFPLISPALVAHMKLTQPQLGTIMLAAMIGQYASAAPVGKVLDRFGPWSCSLLASLMFASGYGLFALDYTRSPETPEPSSAFPHLVVYFALLGLGTVFSYFSMLFAATRTFPQYVGLASGTSLAIFGMSPLFLSMVATRFFIDASANVDVTRFFTFMAVLTGIINLIGGLILPGPATEAVPKARPSPDDQTDYNEDAQVTEVNEEASLLAMSSIATDSSGRAILAQEPDHVDAVGLLKDPYFWVLAIVVSLVVGTAEMIKSNIGLLVLSLPSLSSHENISFQVELIAISDTLTRLLVGPLADLVSPVATYTADGVWAFPRKPYVTRVLFLACASLLFSLTFIWSILDVRTQEALWPLSVSTGIANGTVFTMLPSILSSIWGSPNQGRNFGFVSYTCFFGTTAFAYLYAFVADSHTASDDGVCHGAQCWRLTFWLSAVAALLSTCFSFLLWRKWKARV